MMRERDQNERRPWALKNIPNVLCEQSLAEKYSLLENMCEATGLVVENW